MGYEDGMVDKLKKNYHNIRRPKIKSSNNYRKAHSNFDSSSYSNKKTNSFTGSEKSQQTQSRQKKKFGCNKNFKFSKYHYMSKKALYEYQIEECRQGLIDDALKQMDYIFGLIKNDENKRLIKCKIDEINKFIEIHNINDHNVEKRKNTLTETFKKNFN